VNAPPADELLQLGVRFERPLERPRVQVLVAVLGALLLGALLVARVGTVGARTGAAVGVGAAVVGTVLYLRWRRRVAREPSRTLRAVFLPLDPEAAGRALRALDLEGTTSRDGTSKSLARMHLARSIAALPKERALEAMGRRSKRLRAVALCVAATTVVVALTNARPLVEGAAVALARGGVSPFTMQWLDGTTLESRPPDYLHLDKALLQPGEPVAVHRGTLLTVRGTVLHPARRLALSDGATEVPFADDGAGGVVARWVVRDECALRVIARFGNVVIEEAERTVLLVIADELPIVKLEGAPREIRLLSDEASSDIPLRYEASDDHGLREVQLVLRSGEREERRLLSKLDGETREDRGGYVFRVRDPFVRRARMPVELRVEARDNDVVAGPKWGKSEAVILVPPTIGEPEAMRLSALRDQRDKLVDLLAARLDAPWPAAFAERRQRLVEEAARDDEALATFEETLTRRYGGLRVSSRLQAMIRAKRRALGAARDSLRRSQTPAAYDALIQATERFVLVVDAVVRGQSERDAREVSKQLAEPAESLVSALQLVQRSAESGALGAQADQAVKVLDEGGAVLRRLGPLGRDIGGIVAAYLRRVARARGESDLVHAELAARDLALRLRTPDPSFDARGSRRGGGESGGGRGAPGDEGEAGDDAEQAFNEAARELDQLAGDHAQSLGETEQAVSRASGGEEGSALGEEGRRHAKSVREGAGSLPSVGGGSDSWTSKGAAAREHAEQMARSLEQGAASDAVSSGRQAVAALDEARRLAARERYFGGADESVDKTLREARARLDGELGWAEQKLAELRRRAADKASAEVRAFGEREQALAERTRNLRGRGHEQDALPAAALDALDAAEQRAREAARALADGDAERGLAAQREAQRMFEMAREAMGTSPDGDRGAEGEGLDDRAHADIPKAGASRGPDEFRRRVVRGLGSAPQGTVKEAVRRYAEELLR
jgi:hypothetical protein